MTKNEFNWLCCNYGIAPEIALEDEEIQEALKNRDDKKVDDLMSKLF